MTPLEIMIRQLDDDGLAKLGVAWFDQLNAIAARDPVAAERLAVAMLGHLRKYTSRAPVAPLVDDSRGES